MAPDHDMPPIQQPNFDPPAQPAPEHLPPPPPATPAANAHFSAHAAEYAIYTISLWFAASSLTWILVNLINGSHSFDYLVVPISVLITSLPIFAFMFIRLHRAELAKPELKQDISRRRWIQFTQILAFLTCLINVITFVYIVLQHFGSSSSESIPKAAGSLVVVLLVAGGILLYYWSDSHKRA